METTVRETGMRHALVTLLASFFGVLVALFAFHIYTKYEADRERAADRGRTAGPGRAGPATGRTDPGRGPRRRSAIRNDAVASTAARMAVTEFYMNTGRMPASNAEAGLPEPDTYQGQSLRSLEVPRVAN